MQASMNTLLGHLLLGTDYWDRMAKVGMGLRIRFERLEFKYKHMTLDKKDTSYNLVLQCQLRYSHKLINLRSAGWTLQ